MTRLAARSGDVTKPVAAIHIHDGTLKSIERGWIRTDGALKEFFGQYSVSLSSDTAHGHANSGAIVNVTSSPVTCLVDGGIGTISYVWSRTAPDGHSWTINSPSAETTTFSTLADELETWTATFICTATDQAGNSSASSAVTVTNSNVYFGGGGIGGGLGGPYP